MLKERNNPAIVKRLARKYTKVLSRVIFFLLSPNLYFHIFFHGHVPYYILTDMEKLSTLFLWIKRKQHPHRHEGNVYILPMNQKEIPLYIGCVLPLFLGLRRHFYTLTQKLQDEDILGKSPPPHLLFSNLFSPHNSFNFPNLRTFSPLSPPLYLGHFPLYLCSVEMTRRRHTAPDLRARGPCCQAPSKGLPRQHCSSAAQGGGGNEAT